MFVVSWIYLWVTTFACYPLAVPDLSTPPFFSVVVKDVHDVGCAFEPSRCLRLANQSDATEP